MTRLMAYGGASALAWGPLWVAAPAGLSWLCGADGLVSSIPAWEVGRLLSLVAMWGVMGIAMMLPCIEVAQQDRNLVISLLMAAASGALAHWALESACLLNGMAAVENGALRAALLLAIGLAEVAKWRRPNAAAPLIQMICLQFVGGAMDLGWMAAVTLWMLADAMLHRQLRGSPAQLERRPI